MDMQVLIVSIDWEIMLLHIATIKWKMVFENYYCIKYTLMYYA